MLPNNVLKAFSGVKLIVNAFVNRQFAQPTSTLDSIRKTLANVDASASLNCVQKNTIGMRKFVIVSAHLLLHNAPRVTSGTASSVNASVRLKTVQMNFIIQFMTMKIANVNVLRN